LQSLFLKNKKISQGRGVLPTRKKKRSWIVGESWSWSREKENSLTFFYFFVVPFCVEYSRQAVSMNVQRLAPEVNRILYVKVRREKAKKREKAS
jgi:hypothetical protein